MTATILPFPGAFPERRWTDEPRDLLDRELRKMALIVQESERRRGFDTPVEVIYARCLADEPRLRELLKVRRPRPAKGEMVRRVLERAQARRRAREAR